MIKVNVDFSDILSLEQLKDNVERNLSKAAEELALQTHAKILEIAQEKLKSLRTKYTDALKFSQVGPDTWMISLDKEALFIEDGLPPGFDMLPGLLNSPKAKMGKNGRYISVPFEQNTRPQNTPRNAKDLNNAVRKELKNRGINYSKLDVDERGNPKLGLLHSFDFGTPIKTKEGPYQGRGKIGAPRQGKTGIPFLQGVRVYQKEISTPKGPKVQRAILTFRTASENSDGWKHPGLTALKAFEEACDFALREWSSKIAGQVLDAVIETI